ncbi:MAG: hypothetical protein QNJ12_17605 [Ilumatobacter sp.]|uniref:hypothetical protein n=1 Tax=Ilumatobacter sp. TaxID=1967498 RepID=UPI002613A53B|nr:hypothetical protein [Ilumatobacter sp.]MDJ0770614.1 hypothetical protein [Ilumatobacter sp.]
MADLEAQIRSLADRRFAATAAVEFAPDEQHDTPREHNQVAGAKPIDGTEFIMRSNETSQPPRRWYVLGAAAGLIALVVVGIALAARDDDPARPATTLPPATTPDTLPPVESVVVELAGADGNAEAIEAFETVIEAYEAFNRGDGMGWSTAREGPSPPPADLDDPEVVFVAAAHAAGARYEVTSCAYEGLIEDLEASGGDETVGGHRFACQTKRNDAFSMAAGIDFDEEFGWTVANGQVVDAVSSFVDLNRLQSFMIQLHRWVASEHPETAFTAIEWYGYPLATEVPAVLDLMDEFLAASDVYPLTDE